MCRVVDPKPSPPFHATIPTKSEAPKAAASKSRVLTPIKKPRYETRKHVIWISITGLSARQDVTCITERRSGQPIWLGVTCAKSLQSWRPCGSLTEECNTGLHPRKLTWNPKNEGLEDVSPFQMGVFWVPC